MATTTPTLLSVVASAALQRDQRPRTDLGEGSVGSSRRSGILPASYLRTPGSLSRISSLL
jgi:hypothetical protein